ncbi:MAG: hypothetical protein WD989_00875 [Candidatus Paceibacterota bacterium]
MFEKLTTQEEKPVEAEKEIRLEEVAELEKPIKKIIEKIKDRIENGEYGLIIGDDASGRIPARILGDFIREISKIKGLYQPNTIFIPSKLQKGGWFFKEKENQQDKFEQHISKFGAVPNKKILIITDTVFSGESLKVLTSLIRNAGYDLDIATIGQEFDGPLGRPDAFPEENLRGAQIISGEFEMSEEQKQKTGWAHTPKIYANKKMSGVFKSGFKSRKLADSNYTSDLERDQIQYSIEQSRVDAKKMTNRLVDWYLQLQNEK